MSPPMRFHVPNSSALRLLVTIRVKIMPVITLVKPIAKEINPEYVTRILDNLTILSNTWLCLILYFFVN
jgi:hypothetical protein